MPGPKEKKKDIFSFTHTKEAEGEAQKLIRTSSRIVDIHEQQILGWGHRCCV